VLLLSKVRLKSVGDSDTRNKTSMEKGNDRLPFEKLIFHNGSQVCDDDSITFFAMTAT